MENCTTGLGSQFLFEDNSLKYYASCGHTHAAIEATIKAVTKAACQTDDIKAIDVRIYQAAIDLLGNVKPDTPFGAKFNLPFCIATAAKYKQAGTEDFTPERLQDPDVSCLMKRIIIKSDEALSRCYPQKWPARVKLVLNDGWSFSEAVQYPKGDPQNPLSESELIEKFMSLTGDILTPQHADRMIKDVMNLEAINDVSTLLDASE